MDHPKWDMKMNYMLACSVSKYGLNPGQWDLVSNELSNYIKLTPQACKRQFDVLCEQYGRDWQKQTVEPLHSYVFSMIKHFYYGDLCERMTESRDLLMVMYDFIRLFRGGHIGLNDINNILQDVKNTVPTGDNTQENDRQQKIKMLERLRYHMAKQIPRALNTQYSSYPVELLPPPPFPQQSNVSSNSPQEHSLINDREVPSINSQHKSNALEGSSFPVIIHSNNSMMNNDKQNTDQHPSNGNDLEEIELSSDDDDDDDDDNDDDNDRTAIAQISNIDEPMTSSNLIDQQDYSTSMSDEPIETNESCSIPPMPIEGSISIERDSSELVSSTSMSNQSTFDTQPMSSINGHPVPSNLQLNTSISSSSDYITLDSDRMQLGQSYHPIGSESNATTPRRIAIDDDEVARMDADQIPEPIPADITDVTVANDNAVFVMDELVSSTTPMKIPPAINNDQYSIESISQISTIVKSSGRQSRVPASSTSSNFRKSISSILMNLKNAKYGPDFSKSLQHLKLPNDYYFRVKQPLDITAIRERINNGDYDDNILLFERDVLLMFTNAMTMYHRDLDIHGRAQFMMNFATELLTPVEGILTPWKNDLNINDETDSNEMVSNQTSSIASTSSSFRLDSLIKNLRRQGTSDHHTPKRQRTTTD